MKTLREYTEEQLRNKEFRKAYEIFSIDFMGLGRLHRCVDGTHGVIVLNDIEEDTDNT